ncbi:hypothetical protein F442_17611, partial [Phytophthora nicotianae P10297]
MTLGIPTWLSDEERGRNLGLFEGGLCIRDIAKKIKRSRDAVVRALTGGRRDRRKPGRKPVVSERLARLLLRKASGDYSAAQLKIE